MKTRIHSNSHLPHSGLQQALYPVAKRLQQTKRLRFRRLSITRALIVCAGLALVSLFSTVVAKVSVLLGFLTVGYCLMRSWQNEKRILIDYLEAARAVEKENPELKQSLITAVEQQLHHQTGFFADRTAELALASPSLFRWGSTYKSESTRSHLNYIATLAATFAIMSLNLIVDEQASIKSERHSVTSLPYTVSVEPGNVEVEHGTSLVVTARFPDKLPESASLFVQYDNGEEQSFDMARSLSDPVFAFSLRNIDSSATYRIAYDKHESEDYRIATYRLPELFQADASLDYPDYTGWEDAEIEDTLRITAVEGTKLVYRFTSKTPLESARLTSDNGQQVLLQPEPGSRTLFLLSKTLQQNERYALELTDSAGRKNAYPPEVTIKVIPNDRPVLRINTPRGDQRLSLLEELTISGVASDDFGLLDYGVGLVVATQTQSDISLHQGDTFELPLERALSYDLSLEEYGLSPKDTLNWFLWAVDYGPDGQPRRTTGDLFFADIRSFDELFREQDQAGSNQGGAAANQGMELIERQRRISISLFRIKNTATDADAIFEDLDVVKRSQQEAMNDLQNLMQQLQEPSARQHAQNAMLFMHGVYEELDTAINEPSLRLLEAAWRNAQGAYDSLVKLNDDEFNVSRSQNQSGGGGQQPSRNQSQINELDFRQEDSRYETASQAQELGRQEDRQNLELISKLNELSQRQDDLNERLQELQSALAQAETEDEREEIRRELKRLEEEQREMLADADEAIQQAGNRQQTRQAREQLEQARENMRQAGEQMSEGQVSQALASGSRAQNTLEETREQLRESNSNQFSEAMRDARSSARELAESQEQLEEELRSYAENERRSLDDSEQRDAFVNRLSHQSETLDELLESVKEIAEAAENVEPGLFRELYQILRDTNGNQFEERYENSSQFLRQGFLEEASEEQRGISEQLGELSEAVSSAASGILGSEEATLEFAQSELDSLNQQLQEEQDRSPPGEEPSASEQANAPQSAEEAFRSGMESFSNPNSSPITGSGYGEWLDRLRTVESLIEEPQIRERVSSAREIAESMRRDFKRHGEIPQWDMVVNEIATPLTEASSWLATELSRIKNPDTLQSIDSDPVPEAYSAAVNRYYESLGEEEQE